MWCRALMCYGCIMQGMMNFSLIRTDGGRREEDGYPCESLPCSRGPFYPAGSRDTWWPQQGSDRHYCQHWPSTGTEIGHSPLRINQAPIPVPGHYSVEGLWIRRQPVCPATVDGLI